MAAGVVVAVSWCGDECDGCGGGGCDAILVSYPADREVLNLGSIMNDQMWVRGRWQCALCGEI